MAKFPLIGPSVKSLANELSYQRSINFQPIFVGPVDSQGKGQMALIHSPGVLQIDQIAGQTSRGIMTSNDQTYMVVDNKLYHITINLETLVASHTLIGTLNTSSGIIRWAANTSQIMIVDGSSSGYIITLSDDTFTILGSGDNFYGGTHVVCYDGYFVYNMIGTSFLRCSALNDGLTWDTLDVATAENHPDGIVGLAVTKGELWVLGTETIEVWYNAANPSGFPLSPRVGAALTIGCSSPYSILEANNMIMFIDSRGYVVQSQVSPYIRNQSSGYELNTISTFELNSELAGYSRLDDIIAMTYNDRGRVMYQFTSPSDHTTWVYDLNTATWSERSFFDPYYQDHREHLTQFRTRQGQIDLVCGIRDGTLYIQSPNYYTDNGYTIHRVRRVIAYMNEGVVTPPIGRVEIRATCSANAISPGNTPQIMLKYSIDGGHHWSDDIPRDLGMVGETAKHIIWNRLGAATEWVFEFTVTEPVSITLLEAYFNAS